jgi:hypothetical protein
MKSLGDAVALRNRLIAHMEEADTKCSHGEHEPLLTFVVAGGGFAGVETIAAINDLCGKPCRSIAIFVRRRCDSFLSTREMSFFLSLGKSWESTRNKSWQSAELKSS